MPIAVLAAYLAVWAAAAVEPLYFDDWLLENVLVFVAVPILIGTYRRFRFSNASYLLVALFLALHAVGAHYTYSEVPLGAWMREAWQLDRNHYDRVVHLAFGALIGQPMYELLVHLGAARGRRATVLTVHVLVAWSGTFELVEALVAFVAAPDLGAAYTGAQGDPWDAQKDVALALGGALLWAAAATAIGVARGAAPGSGAARA
jgi:putative membrane protein